MTDTDTTDHSSDHSADASTADLPTPGVALVIVAHPDDAEFQAGATLAKWARNGTEVHHLVLTDGSKGTWDPSVDQAALVERRLGEQRDAARELGATGTATFFGEVDGELTPSVELRGRVAEVIRRVRPDVVLGHDPWKRHRLHPDHRAAGQLCVDGIVAARDPFFHPEQLVDGLTPHRPDALLLFEPDEVNHVEQVESVDIDAKLAALEAHRSQMETTHFYRVGDGDPLEEFRARERDRLGEPAAECYFLIVDQL